jgi:hypothetical protein
MVACSICVPTSRPTSRKITVLEMYASISQNSWRKWATSGEMRARPTELIHSPAVTIASTPETWKPPSAINIAE